MSLIIKKFGGTSVANAECINRVADIIAKDYRLGNEVVAVVSAQGDTTDNLIASAKEINPDSPSKRELDVLLSAGEQISASLLSIALERKGCPAVSLLGWQAGFITDTNYGFARIKEINPERIKTELAKKNIVIVAGFQGINRYDDITTLGRGGSDTSAVAIAAAMNANICQIYTDVDGVYTADPRIVKNAKKLDEITYDEMLELACLGANVLNNRSVELAKKYNVQLEVLSSFNQSKGTVVKENTKMEKLIIKGVAKDTNVSILYISGISDAPGIAYKVFNRLASYGITVDIILHTAETDGKTDIMFAVKKDDCKIACEAIETLKDDLNYKRMESNGNVAKISVVGSALSSHPGVAAKVFGALYGIGVNILMISAGETKLSVIIDEKDADRSANAIHDALIK